MSRCKRDALAAELTGRNGRRYPIRTDDLVLPKHARWPDYANRRGPGETIRTPDPLLPKQMLCLAELHPDETGLAGRARTAKSRFRRSSAAAVGVGEYGAHEGDRTLQYRIDSAAPSPAGSVRNGRGTRARTVIGELRARCSPSELYPRNWCQRAELNRPLTAYRAAILPLDDAGNVGERLSRTARLSAIGLQPTSRAPRVTLPQNWCFLVGSNDHCLLTKEVACH